MREKPRLGAAEDVLPPSFSSSNRPGHGEVEEVPKLLDQLPGEGKGKMERKEEPW